MLFKFIEGLNGDTEITWHLQRTFAFL